MNWKEIEKKHPKGYEKYLDWNHSDDCPSVECYQFNKRDLYDFFDEQEIYCSVYSKDSIKGKIWWNDIGAFGRYIPLKTRESRREAEEQVFLKAFEILEEQCIL